MLCSILSFSDFLVLFPVGTGVMLNIDITGRSKSICHCLVSDFVLFPVDTGVRNVKDWEMKYKCRQTKS